MYEQNNSTKQFFIIYLCLFFCGSFILFGACLCSAAGFYIDAFFLFIMEGSFVLGNVNLRNLSAFVDKCTFSLFLYFLVVESRQIYY